MRDSKQKIWVTYFYEALGFRYCRGLIMQKNVLTGDVWCIWCKTTCWTPSRGLLLFPLFSSSPPSTTKHLHLGIYVLEVLFLAVLSCKTSCGDSNWFLLCISNLNSSGFEPNCLWASCWTSSGWEGAATRTSWTHTSSGLVEFVRLFSYGVYHWYFDCHDN